jgi:hypothetical protein
MSGLMFWAKWPATCAALLDCDTSLKRRADIQPTGTYAIVSLSSVESSKTCIHPASSAN